MSAKEKRARRRWPKVLGLVVLAVLVLGTAGVRVFLHGGRLAAIVQSQLNQRIRGRVEVASIEWPLSALPAVLVGGDLPVTLRGVKVYDTDERVVIDSPAIVATLDSGAAMFGRHDLILRDIHIAKGYALIRQVRQPSPRHEYDTHTVSLIDAFNARERPRFEVGVTARSAAVFDLANYRLDDVDLVFEYPEAHWKASVRGAHTKPGQDGSLTFDGRDPIVPRLFYSLAPTAREATLTIGEPPNDTSIELRDIEVAKLRQLPLGWPDETLPSAFEYVATAKSVEGAEVKVDGKMFQSFTDVFGSDHDLTLEVTRAGGLARRLSAGLADGDDLAIKFRLAGPGLAPAYHAQLTDLELDVPIAPDKPRLPMKVERLTASYNTATATGAIEDTVASGAGGTVRLAATFNRRPDTADLRLAIDPPIDLLPYLPPRVAKSLGHTLSGTLHAFGTTETQRLDELDLRLGNARVTGGLHRTADGKVYPEALEVSLGGTAARRITGVVDGETGEVAVDFLVRSTDLGRWLRAFGQPAVARTLNGRVSVRGTTAAPTARASLTAGGVPVVGRLDADVDYRPGEVHVREVQSSLLGGWLRGSGRVLLGPRPRLADVEAQGVNLDLRKVPGLEGVLKGELDVTAQASGELGAPRGELVAKLRRLEIAGDAYADTTVTVAAGAGEPIALTTAIKRQAGGELAIDARYDPSDQGLGGVVDLRKLPLEALTSMLGLPRVAGGRIDASLALSGTPSAPTADGAIEVTRGWFKQTFLGSAGLSLERVGPGTIRVGGRLLQGKVEIEGTVSTEAPFAADLALRLRRVELDLFAPELAARHGVRGWVSGDVVFRGDLSLARPGRTSLTATLSEAVVVLDSEVTGLGPAGLRVANKTPIELAYDGKRLALVKDVVLTGPTGDFTLSGSASPERLAVTARGEIAVGLLGPYLRQYFERVSGELVVSLSLTGSLAEPRLAGVAEVVDIAMQPTGQDTVVRIPGGKLELDGDQVSLTGLSMVVADQFSEELSEIHIAGGVRLVDFKPARWAVRIDGELDGKMLLVVAPKVFSSGFGSADLSIALLGDGLQPDIDGSVEFSPDTPLTIVPRGARREIALTGGFVKFTDQLIELGEISGTVDDEGAIERLEGEISLDAWRPVDIDVALDASALPVRIPDALDLAVNLRRLRFVGGEDRLDISGTVEIPDGRFIRKFNIVTDVLKPERASTPSKPFWETTPLLARARLDLTIQTQAFYVKNNIATIAMSGQVTLGGTPTAPRLDGVIRVDDGTFKFQGIRPRFERAGGTVSFEPLQSFPDGTPRVDLRAEADYTDSSGQAHLIHMSLKGTLSTLDWDLRTESGLNRSQTMQLILAGRTPEEVRAALGDTAIGKPGAISDAEASGGSGFVYADQFVKDLSGDFFSLLIGDSLRNVTQLDVARLTLGTNAIGGHFEKHITPSLRLNGDFESSLRGWNWDLTGEYRFTDNWSFDATWGGRRYDDEALEDEEKGSLQSTWRWVLLP